MWRSSSEGVDAAQCRLCHVVAVRSGPGLSPGALCGFRHRFSTFLEYPQKPLCKNSSAATTSDPRRCPRLSPAPLMLFQMMKGRTSAAAVPAGSCV
ncbi:hypothetical protein GDO81_014585 [Engystomops pustulosus]|uniref:Uncharacterized protein n=1 Tax=Engystomops pustulosus TaxID=76066 RepID=A0AAV7BBH6_ENGPU|nr:hypothetical protein GDO81_014585 [Engystomops pustulosus]